MRLPTSRFCFGSQLSRATWCALAMVACGGSGRGARRDAEATRARAAPVISRVVLDDRPVLSLVARAGDPRAALAFAARHDRGSAASAAFAEVLAARLESAGIGGIESRAHGLGLELSALVSSPAEASRFVAELRSALATEIRVGDATLERAQRASEALRSLRFAGAGEAAAAACSGELGLAPGDFPLDVGHGPGVAELEQTRRRVFASKASALSALGAREILEAATEALSDAEAWPDVAASDEPWPVGDSTALDRARGARRLSVALRLADADAAVGAGLAMASPGSPLLQRLEALAPPWRLERASGVARSQGACLRLDVVPEQGDPGPSAAEVGRVAALVEADALRAAGEAPPGSLDESILRASDPRRAATLAAWDALGSEAPSGARLRRTVVYQAEPADGVRLADIDSALADARLRLTQPSFELRVREEPGQGELWMLLASPCGTTVEASADAGALALALRAAAEGARHTQVRLEPWVTSEGIGLLAHAPRTAPAESAEEQARRIAGALGRALGVRLEGTRIGRARADQQRELGGRSFPGWVLALDGLSPEHASWLEPRGSWESISELSGDALERARRLFLGAPLRLSVLTNVEAGQATSAAEELESWLLPLRAELRSCPAVRMVPPRRGETTLRTNSNSAPEGAYVGVLLEPHAGGARAAELSALLLNRPGGGLERALAQGAPGAHARAQALGGARRPALVIAVRAVPDQLAEAVSRVRGALDQLAQGGQTAEELAFAEDELSRREAQERFDPRRRIVELWRGAPTALLGLSELRSLQAAFGLSGQWVVTVSSSEQGAPADR